MHSYIAFGRKYRKVCGEIFVQQQCSVCRRSPGGFTELVQLVIFVGIDIYGKLFDQTGEQICVVLIYFGWGTEPQPKYIRTTQITLASFLNENAPTIK